MKLETSRAFNFRAWNGLLAYLAGDQVNSPVSRLAQSLLVPAAALLVFLMLWAVGAKNVETSLGQLPGPAKVWEQTVSLYQEHKEERAKEAAFDERMQKRFDNVIQIIYCKNFANI